jgi:hypothetical protein
MPYKNIEEYKAYQKKYNLNNKERLSKIKKEYRLKNKNKFKEYYLKNKDRIKELQQSKKYKETKKLYRLNNIEFIKQINRNYYLNNKDKVKKYSIQYSLNNPNFKRSHCAKRRALQLKATPKFANLNKIKEIYKNCPKGYHVDHIVPLNSKLVCGLHVEWNLQYLTPSANLSKSNKLII